MICISINLKKNFKKTGLTIVKNLKRIVTGLL